ncbi:hypothetical protein FRB99_000239 [Tulasnella sp. 403]|nr:hypothetical protein FRB99_000239 [Tulasnella sp. 403]
MSSPAPDPAAAIKEAAYFIRASQIFFSALYAVCLWDWLVSLQREWILIWKTRWSIIKCLYLLCRYWVILTMPYVLWVYIEDHSLNACNKLYRSPVAIAMWNQLWAEGVLLIRTYAFLGNKLPVLIGLVLALCAVVAYQLYVDITQMALLPFLDPSGGPCFPTVKFPGSPHIMAFFLAPLLYDTLVTCLTLWRAWELRKQTGGRSGSPLLKTFVQEGLYYFFLISAANLVNAIFYWQPKQVMSALLIPMSVMFPDVLACRMILGLRERGVHHTSAHAQSTSYTHSRRKYSDANKLATAGGPGTVNPGAMSKGNGKDIGAITDMDFNHELTTFDRSNGTNIVRGGDSESIVGRDVKTIPYEVEEVDPARARNGIRVDIESHRYYEASSDGENDKKGASFVP